jgi:alpha-tubulin suppressor-like RCC1 family protein
LPAFLDVLQKEKIIAVRAGSFSAAISHENRVFFWGHNGTDHPKQLG